jgi:hypothetical protein
MRAIANGEVEIALDNLKAMLDNLKEYVRKDMVTWLPDPEIRIY